MIFQLHTHDNLFSSQDSERSWDSDSDCSGEPTVTTWAAVVVLVITTGLAALCAEDFVGSLDDFVEDSKLSKNFVGLILIPIVSNAAEHATAVVVAIKNKMDLVGATSNTVFWRRWWRSWLTRGSLGFGHHTGCQRADCPARNPCPGPARLGFGSAHDPALPYL